LVAKLPPQWLSARPPVAGDLVVTTNRFDCGALVPVSGPTEKIRAIASSYGSSPGRVAS